MRINGHEWLDIGLPTPSYLLHTQYGAFIGWCIDGYPGTKKAREYFADTVARIIIAFRDNKPERLSYRPNLERRAHVVDTVYQLGDISGALPSIPKQSKYYKSADSLGNIDSVFWAIKLYIEDWIEENGEIPIPFEALHNWAYSNFWELEQRVKDKSTLRAKCRSVWNWYNDREWKKTVRSFEMTRSERALQNAKNREEQAKKRVLMAVTNLISADFKKKNGKWNIAKIAKHLEMSRNTVAKHLKQLKEEGKI